MDKIEARKIITERFYLFKNKLVDEYPEYRKNFDDVISDAYDKDLLWNLLESAENKLKYIIDKKGGVNNLLGSDYYKALCD